MKSNLFRGQLTIEFVIRVIIILDDLFKLFLCQRQAILQNSEAHLPEPNFTHYYFLKHSTNILFLIGIKVYSEKYWVELSNGLKAKANIATFHYYSKPGILVPN